VYKIAIVGASTLLGQEVREALSESALAAATLRLLDAEQARGQMEQVGDEISLVEVIAADSFEQVDFSFFCGTEELTRRWWKEALRAGSTVLDLTGALDQEPGVLVRTPWMGVELSADLLTPAIVPAHPAALTLAMLLERLGEAAPVRLAAATVLQPASENGRAAMDELHQQTVNLLSFQGIPRDTFDAQAAFNLMTGVGEAAKISLSTVEAHIRHQVTQLLGHRAPALMMQLVQAPVFHGYTISLAVELERAVDLTVLDEVLNGDRMDLVLEDTDSPSNLAVTGQNDILVRLRPERDGRNPNQARRLWLWVATDNLRMAAQNAIDCATDLRKLRPKGSVQ